ncbi:DEAD/DEAH box helicase [Danxiaibacter flavus]|uniref:DEAD/DEAH box helicase n=1 Tax=Danxiaibacter flavus TaxID=3049108 RepID=A0ABV3ZH92_9BACT|nr:DEAD/DEAH box helicase [Chitinophagaceae bacterium DXS]
MTFQDLQLSEPILRALTKEGYTQPTPIQEQAIPVVLKQRDLLACAQTGTGKTAAFALPVIQLLLNAPQHSKGYKHIRTLVITPTRELALQIDESFAAYGKYTGLKHDVIFGGVSQHAQTIALRNGTDVLIATPGRLLDLMNQGYIHLAHLEFLVIDEADRMLDMGFIHDIRKVMRELPKERQTLFFSATMPPEIAKLANALLQNPVKIEVTPVSTTAEKVDQTIYMVAKQDKSSLLLHLLREKDIQRTLVFTRTKYGADKIAKHLNQADIRTAALHGDKSQEARQRALHNFKTGRLRVLVATDIVARGIDVDDLSHVINYDLPEVPETYVHRIGRTGRADKSGIAISFCSREERANLRDIHRVTAQVIPVTEDHPYHSRQAEAPAQPNNKRKPKKKPYPQKRREPARMANQNANQV